MILSTRTFRSSITISNIFYELHFVGENASYQETEAPLSDRAVLCSVKAGFLSPVRPHEKITLRVDQSSSFFLAICTSLLYLYLESTNLPFRKENEFYETDDLKENEARKRSYLFITNNELRMKADTIIPVAGDSLKPLFHDGDLLYIKHIHSECEASDGDFVIGTTPSHRCRMMRMTNGEPASLRFYLPGEKHDEEPVTITGLVLGVVNPQDLAAPEGIPLLEEYHRDEIKALEEKCKN